MTRTAEISECGRYRWWLQRRWADGPIVSFVMLNPSTADAEQDDPTIRKCIAFAMAWGFGTLDVRNLYPWRATSPADLMKAMRFADVTGGERWTTELSLIRNSGLIVAGWGNHATDGIAARFLDLTAPYPIWCLGKNGNGSPKHPLYLAGSSEPEPFARCDGSTWRHAKC